MAIRRVLAEPETEFDDKLRRKNLTRGTRTIHGSLSEETRPHWIHRSHGGVRRVRQHQLRPGHQLRIPTYGRQSLMTVLTQLPRLPSPHHPRSTYRIASIYESDSVVHAEKGIPYDDENFEDYIQNDSLKELSC